MSQPTVRVAKLVLQKAEFASSEWPNSAIGSASPGMSRFPFFHSSFDIRGAMSSRAQRGICKTTELTASSANPHA